MARLCLIVAGSPGYCRRSDGSEPGFDMEQNATRAAWVAPELKSIEIATTASAGKTAVFVVELPDFGAPTGPS